MNENELSFEMITEKNLDLFLKLKSEFIQNFAEDAKEVGIDDTVAKKYTEAVARESFNKNKDKRHSLYIKRECREYPNEIIGFVEYTFKKSDYINESILHLDNIFIIEEYQNKGIGKLIVEKLKEISLHIELECYYKSNAHVFYQKLGFLPIYTKYYI